MKHHGENSKVVAVHFNEKQEKANILKHESCYRSSQFSVNM